MALNVVVLIGRLTATPELRNTQSGVSVTNFSIAVDRSYQPKGEEKTTDFINIVAWRNTAEFICKYFQKGSMIAVQGEIQTRTYTDNDGNNRYVTEVVANNVSFCGSKSESGSQNNTSPAPFTTAGTNTHEQNTAAFEQPTEQYTSVSFSGDDDLPF